MEVNIQEKENCVYVKMKPQKRTIKKGFEDEYYTTSFLQFPEVIFKIHYSKNMVIESKCYFIINNATYLPPLPSIDEKAKICQTLYNKIANTLKMNVNEFIENFWSSPFSRWFTFIRESYNDLWFYDKVTDEEIYRLIDHWEKNDIFQLPLLVFPTNIPNYIPNENWINWKDW